MEFLYSWIKNIVIFMIIVTIIMNMLGKSDFKKYISVITGMLLVVITITPILELLKLDSVFAFNFDQAKFNVDTNELEAKLKQAEDEQQQTILENYKIGIKDQIVKILKENELYLVKLDLEVGVENSESFGIVKKIDVVASYTQKDEETESSVLPIQIDKIEIESKSEKSEDKAVKDYASPLEIHIKNTLSDFYNMSSDNINISIQGG